MHHDAALGAGGLPELIHPDSVCPFLGEGATVATMNRILSAVAVGAIALGLSACAGEPTPTPTPTVTVTVTATPEPAPTVTVTAAPTDESTPPAAEDKLSALRTVSPMVTGVQETEPGRWVINTAIVDPRGDDGTSAEAQEAIAICKKAVELGATNVAVMESNGSSFVLYGHPSYGAKCVIP